MNNKRHNDQKSAQNDLKVKHEKHKLDKKSLRIDMTVSFVVVCVSVSLSVPDHTSISLTLVFL